MRTSQAVFSLYEPRAPHWRPWRPML